ncbi:MAG: hypothetical protein AB3N16_03825 [Flavobacteriaceae bacterium]
MRIGIVLAFGCVFMLGCEDENDCCIAPPSNAFDGELQWVKVMGGSGDETGTAVIGTSDGGFAVLGSTNSQDGDVTDATYEVSDYWLLKFDTDGVLQWNRTYGGSGEDLGQSLVQTQDGGYILTGYAQSADGDGSNNEGFHDTWIIKVDATGTIEWERSFGFSGHDHSYDILELDDGYLFVGFLDITAARADGYDEKGASSRHGVGEFWAIKVDFNGGILWRKYFGGTNNDRAHAVVEAPDGGFVLAGFSESDDFDITNPKGSYDFWVLKINETGELVWRNNYGGSGIEIAQDIITTDDGGYIVAGYANSNDGQLSNLLGESDAWLVKIDAFGEVIWTRTMGGSQYDAAWGIANGTIGNVWVVGNSKSGDYDLTENQGENDIWVTRVGAEGILNWQASFGGSQLDFGYDVARASDGGILVVGSSNSPEFEGAASHGGTDMVIMKIK